MDSMTLDKSIDYLSNNTILNNLIKKYPRPKFETNKNYFDSLSKTIIFQQLSAKVAFILHKRFIKLFKNNKISATEYQKISLKELRSIGLSRQKIKYINNLSLFFIKNKSIKNLSTDEICEKLISIKGIGQWTIDMFLMFTMHKTDILPLGDLGIKKAFKELYNLEKLPTEKFMIEKSNNWKPYRTIACCYLWMIVDDGDFW